MKVLLFVVLFGLAAARSIQDTRHVVHDAVVSTQRATEGAGRLFDAVNLPECASVLNAVERDMKTELGKALKHILDKLVNGFKDRVENVKGVVETVKDKIAELKDKLREIGEQGKVKSQEAIDMVRKTVHDIVDTILNKVQQKKDNLDHQMDEVSKLKMKDLIKRLRERIIEKIHGIREYIKDIAADNEAIRQLKALLKQVSDSQLADLLNNILDLSGHEYRHLKDLYEQLKQIGEKSKGILKDKIVDLTGWVNTVWHDGLDELVEKFRNIRTALFEVISNTKDFSVQAIREALKELETYKEHLGDLYEKLVDSLKKIIGKF